MPELAEVELYRRVWDAGIGERVLAVELHAGKRIFRGTDTRALTRALTGAVLRGSEAHGKQMLFRFEPDAWLGLHLGMTGKLRVDGKGARAALRGLRTDAGDGPRHDHLVLAQRDRRLVFADARLFGRVRFHQGAGPPDWWTSLPPGVLSRRFTEAWVAEFLRRRARSPIKPVLLMQERFPGIGNWMADEILWRAGIHPRTPAGALPPEAVRALRREIRAVARGALRALRDTERRLPARWLFHQRWGDGGKCPRTGAPLVRETIGGRTTCWSPARQPEPRPRGSGNAGSRSRKASFRPDSRKDRRERGEAPWRD